MTRVYYSNRSSDQPLASAIVAAREQARAAGNAAAGRGRRIATTTPSH